MSVPNKKPFKGTTRGKKWCGYEALRLLSIEFTCMKKVPFSMDKEENCMVYGVSQF